MTLSEPSESETSRVSVKRYIHREGGNEETHRKTKNKAKLLSSREFRF